MSHRSVLKTDMGSVQIRWNRQTWPAIWPARL